MSHDNIKPKTVLSLKQKQTCAFSFYTEAVLKIKITKHKETQKYSTTMQFDTATYNNIYCIVNGYF